MVTEHAEYRYWLLVYPVQAIFLAGMVPLFLGATISDIAYMKSAHIQWNNFASWLIVGGLIVSAVALVLAIVDLARHPRRSRHHGIYTLLLLATWIVGFFNALMHARDAWASMPSGLVLSVITTLLACAATWFGFYAPRTGVIK